MPQWVQAPDFEGQYPDARLKTQMDRGPAKYRLGTSAAPQPVQGVIRCTLDQLARGDRFWREELNGGTLPFVFPGQVLNNTPLCDESGDPLTDESDVPLLVAEWWLVQFSEAPNFRPRNRSVVWAVPLALNNLP
jgi:hypothetical protein